MKLLIYLAACFFYLCYIYIVDQVQILSGYDPIVEFAHYERLIRKQESEIAVLKGLTATQKSEMTIFRRQTADLNNQIARLQSQIRSVQNKTAQQKRAFAVQKLTKGHRFETLFAMVRSEISIQLLRYTINNLLISFFFIFQGVAAKRWVGDDKQQQGNATQTQVSAR